MLQLSYYIADIIFFGSYHICCSYHVILFCNYHILLKLSYYNADIILFSSYHILFQLSCYIAAIIFCWSYHIMLKQSYWCRHHIRLQISYPVASIYSVEAIIFGSAIIFCWNHHIQLHPSYLIAAIKFTCSSYHIC